VSPSDFCLRSLADIHLRRVDFGLTERALELAFRLKDHIAKSKTSADKQRLAQWEDLLFSTKQYGMGASELRAKFHQLKMKTYDTVSRFLLLISVAKEEER
jgi:hypothetical protein